MPEVERHLEFKQTLMRGVLRPVGHRRQIVAADPAEHVNYNSISPCPISAAV